MRTIRTELPDGRYAVVITLKLRHIVMLACVLSIILGYLIGVLLTVCGIF